MNARAYKKLHREGIRIGSKRAHEKGHFDRDGDGWAEFIREAVAGGYVKQQLLWLYSFVDEGSMSEENLARFLEVPVDVLSNDIMELKGEQAFIESMSDKLEQDPRIARVDRDELLFYVKSEESIPYNLYYFALFFMDKGREVSDITIEEMSQFILPEYQDSAI